MISKDPYKLSTGFIRMRNMTDIPHGYTMEKLNLRNGNLNLENIFTMLIIYEHLSLIYKI